MFKKICGLILLSGNDAAVTLAVADSGSVGSFVKKMNRTALRLGLNGHDGQVTYAAVAEAFGMPSTALAEVLA